MAATKSPHNRPAAASADPGPPNRLLTTLLEAPSARLAAMHRAQVRREPWPDFEAFAREAYPAALRRSAAVQWAGRARNEHGSVHQFSALTHALSEARVPAMFLGALARLITDEVRHAEICAEMALACHPAAVTEDAAILRWPQPRAPWPDAPRPGRDNHAEQDVLRWAADAVVCACCIGETLSRPMLAAVETVATDPVVEAVAAQILRDEQLHATFGWETLAWLVPRLDEASRDWLTQQLPRRFAGFERSTALGIGAEQIAGREIIIAPGDPSEPNLGTLTPEQYAVIFFATFEQEILPGLRDVGLDADWAWAGRLSLLEPAD